MITFKTALKMVSDNINPLFPKLVGLKEALGSVLNEDIFVKLPDPPFDRSAMDGFAIARGESDKYLIRETIPAGKVPHYNLKAGECSKIMTGAMIPHGTEQVIRVEYTETRDGFMNVKDEESQKNIAFKGENIKFGEILLKKGITLKPAHIGILASNGNARVRVQKMPKTGLIVTGSELKNPWNKLKEGEIYNSNGFLLSSLFKEMQLEYINYGIIRDEPSKLKTAICRALKENDLVLITGGMSMGDFDFVPVLLKRLKINLLFEKIAVKPGKPTLFGTRGSKVIFGLPGNPVACFVIFEILVKPAIFKLMGKTFNPVYKKMALNNTLLRKPSDRDEFLPFQITENGILPITYKGSGHISALANVDGLVKIDGGVTRIEKGEELLVRLI